MLRRNTYFLSIEAAMLSFLILFIFSEGILRCFCSKYDLINSPNEMRSGDELRNEHVRKKRYAIFPEGSTFTVALCVTVKLLTPDNDIFTEAINWALTYDLPESVEDYDKNLYGSSPPIVARKKRSDLYKKIETFIDKNGYNGRACILRSLCEVTQLLPENDGFLETIIKLLFRKNLRRIPFELPHRRVDTRIVLQITVIIGGLRIMHLSLIDAECGRVVNIDKSMPLQNLSMSEPREHFEYDSAYRMGMRRDNKCHEIFSSCSISILQIFLNLQPAE